MNRPFPASRTLRVVVLLTAILLNMTGCAINGLDGGKYYALVYGVRNYTDSPKLPHLPGAGKDGKDVRALLSSMGYIIINNKDTTKVTRKDIEAGLRQAAAAVGKNDIFLFYFSGHGGPFPDSENVFIVTSPNSQGEITLWDTGALTKKILDLQAFHHILILDSCYSGGSIDRDDYGVDILPNSLEYPLKLSNDNWVGLFPKFDNFFEKNSTPRLSIMTAAGRGEKSYETSWLQDGVFNGVFTSFLLEAGKTNNAYRNADFNFDGVVTLSEAYAYIFTRIEQKWNMRSLRKHVLTDGKWDDTPFYPHISGGSVDPILFPAP